VQAALQVNVLFLVGAVLAVVLWWMFRATRIGLVIRVVGDSTDAARAMGLNADRVRLLATAAGGAFAGIGGAYLSLFYPGSWNEGISSGQGLMAVALVIFARWNPINCFWAALLFGGAGALGPALQSVGVTEGYYLFFAAPYVLTLGLLIATSSPDRAMQGAPAELSITK
jgi:general nucleoside transport system permease protein